MKTMDAIRCHRCQKVLVTGDRVAEFRGRRIRCSGCSADQPPTDKIAKTRVASVKSDQTANPINREGSKSSSLVAIIVVAIFLMGTSCMVILVGGVSALTVGFALVQFLPISFVTWYAYTPHGSVVMHRVVTWGINSINQFNRWRAERAALRKRAAEEKLAREAAEKQRIVMEQLRKQEEAERLRQKRRADIEAAMQPIQTRWDSLNGVFAEEAITYGVGNEYVYCYTFPTTLEIANLKQDVNFKIKVGMASNHPIKRIQEQISASKTAMSEPAHVLLVFRTPNCHQLEKWLHRKLERAPGALGREWFVTNPNQLLGLFRKYLQDYLLKSGVALELKDSDFWQ